MGRSVDPDIYFLDIRECLLEVIDKTPGEELIQSYFDVYGTLDTEEDLTTVNGLDCQMDMFDILGIELDNIEVTLVDAIETLDEFEISSSVDTVTEGEDINLDDMIEREMALICQEDIMDDSVSNVTVSVSANNNLEVATSGNSRRRKHQYNTEPSSDDEDLLELGIPIKIQKIDLGEIAEFTELSASDKTGLVEFLGTFIKYGMVREKKPTTTIHYPAAQNVYFATPRPPRPRKPRIMRH